MEKQIEQINNNLAQLLKMVGSLIESNHETKKDIASIKVDVSELKADVAELKKDVAELKTDVCELKVEMNIVKDRLSNIEGKLTYLIADVELLDDETRQNKKDINRLKKFLENQ